MQAEEFLGLRGLCGDWYRETPSQVRRALSRRDLTYGLDLSSRGERREDQGKQKPHCHQEGILMAVRKEQAYVVEDIHYRVSVVCTSGQMASPPAPQGTRKQNL